MIFSRGYAESAVLSYGFWQSEYGGRARLQASDDLQGHKKHRAFPGSLQGLYSNRSVVAGSTCAARRAGKYEAAAAAAAASATPSM
jgi:hypothetical protein